MASPGHRLSLTDQMFDQFPEVGNVFPEIVRSDATQSEAELVGVRARAVGHANHILQSFLNTQRGLANSLLLFHRRKEGGVEIVKGALIKTSVVGHDHIYSPS